MLDLLDFLWYLLLDLSLAIEKLSFRIKEIFEMKTLY